MGRVNQNDKKARKLSLEAYVMLLQYKVKQG